MKNKPEPDSDLILYLTEDGRTRLQVRLEGETVWLSLNQMADLFQRDNSVISRHIKNVFEERELSPEGTVAKSATVQTEGEKQVTREIDFYNLDVIISVGYRVKSKRGTQISEFTAPRAPGHGRILHGQVRLRRPLVRTGTPPPTHRKPRRGRDDRPERPCSQHH